MPRAKILIATPESDAKLRKSQNEAGLAAKLAGKPREACPWPDHNSLAAFWWFEGYDSLEVKGV